MKDEGKYPANTNAGATEGPLMPTNVATRENVPNNMTGLTEKSVMMK